MGYVYKINAKGMCYFSFAWMCVSIIGLVVVKGPRNIPWV